MSGPYDTEAQAAAELGQGGHYATLVEACQAAGVELGAYDLRVLGWLARWEPGTVQVVADLIRRAARH